MRDAVIGLGGNLGDRARYLRNAVAEIERAFTFVARSAVYETAPVGPPQPDYFNAAVLVRTDRAPDDVMKELLAIEVRGGRVRRAETRWGPRTIDLDLLWVDGVVLATPALTLPHPRLLERPFALLPLLDVAPNAKDPRTSLPFQRPAATPGVRRTSLRL